MPKYIGATIGPIYNTISRAESTRELWSSSYLFSYIMREIIKKLRDKKFILPYVKDNYYLETGKKIGLFHDRFIFEAESDKDFDEVISKKDEVLENLFQETNIDLKDYISFHLVEREINEDENIIFKMSEYLDVMELQPKLNQNFNYNILFEYFSDKNNLFIKENQNIDIKSLPEIAMRDGYNLLGNKKQQEKIDEIFKDGKENDDVKAYRELQKNLLLKNPKIELKKYNKYYVLLKADGDGIGEIIKKIGDLKVNDKYSEFSKKLFEFAIRKDNEANVYKLIENYEGLPIYIGGDDILCFLPVKNNNDDIFGIIEKISKIFYSLFEEKPIEGLKIEKYPTLSFGITINYYKYPLYEALDKVDEMLYKAKSYGKNAIAINLEKHSGKPIEFIIKKTEYEIPKNIKKTFNVFNDTKYMNGVIKRIENDYFILSIIGKDEEKLNNYFENTFKDKKHKNDSELRDEIKLLKKLLIEFSENDNLKELYKLLKFVCFLNEVGGEDA